MAKISGTASAPSAISTPGKMGAASNVNHDKSVVLRAPRIRALATRNYGKGAPSPYPDPDNSAFGAGVGYGPKEQP